MKLWSLHITGATGASSRRSHAMTETFDSDVATISTSHCQLAVFGSIRRCIQTERMKTDRTRNTTLEEQTFRSPKPSRISARVRWLYHPNSDASSQEEDTDPDSLKTKRLAFSNSPAGRNSAFRQRPASGPRTMNRGRTLPEAMKVRCLSAEDFHPVVR